MKRLVITGGSSAIGRAVGELASMRGWLVISPTHDELDVIKEVSVRDYFATIRPVDAIVLAASFHERAELKIQPVHKTISTILNGTIYCIREFTKNNLEGGIVSITSEAARTGGRQLSAYVAAKAGVNALTLALSRELAPYFRINAVSLGVVDTENNKERDGSLLPFKRKGTPKEVAQAVLWLLSDEASYVSGAVLPVAGAY